jgi:type IV secretory pathway VirB2 component (pilin)
MLGFVAAVGAELATGEGVLTQLKEAPGGIAAAFMVFIAASLIPMLSGSKETSVGPFNAKVR